MQNAQEPTLKEHARILGRRRNWYEEEEKVKEEKEKEWRPRAPQNFRNRHGQQQKRAMDDYSRLLKTRSKGLYVPPSKLLALQSLFTDPQSEDFQRIQWEKLKKNVRGLINRLNTDNIEECVIGLFKVNLIRARGIFSKSIMRAQQFSPSYTPQYAALAAIINTKIPQVGELLLHRLVMEFRQSWQNSDRDTCLRIVQFIGHLINMQMAHEIIALQILALLLNEPTNTSIEIAVDFLKQIGLFLMENSPKANNSVYDKLRALLHDGRTIDLRTKYLIEDLFHIRRDNFKNFPQIQENLDLIEEDDNITHLICLDDEELDAQLSLNEFQYDPDYLESEDKYKHIRNEILGPDEEVEEEDYSDHEIEAVEPTEPTEPVEPVEPAAALPIVDKTDQDTLALRKAIYLTIMSSVDYEECCHKLLKLKISTEKESMLCNMVIECCSQERVYTKFYGLVAERFCRLNRKWMGHFTNSFKTYYDTIHRYEINNIRNIGKVFAHLFSTDAIQWEAFESVRLTEDDTTSSSRIFLKILFQEIVAALGTNDLKCRFESPDLQPYLGNIFPTDSMENLRFAINYFTSIELGCLTEGPREKLKELVELEQEQLRHAEAEAASSPESGHSKTTNEYHTSRQRSASTSSQESARSPRPLEHSDKKSEEPAPSNTFKDNILDDNDRKPSYSQSRNRRNDHYRMQRSTFRHEKDEFGRDLIPRRNINVVYSDHVSIDHSSNDNDIAPIESNRSSRSPLPVRKTTQSTQPKTPEAPEAPMKAPWQ